MQNLLRRLPEIVLRRGDDFIRSSTLLRPWRFADSVDAEDLPGNAIVNRQTIVPANDHVSLQATPIEQEFLRICRYFRDGTFARPRIFTCEVPDGYCHVSTGIICTRDFEAINESQMKYRLTTGPARIGRHFHRPFQWFKPLRVRRVVGTCATISNVFMHFWGHWIFDCLPRLYSLEKASGGSEVSLLVPDDLPTSYRDSLACVLPANFKLMPLPGNSWVRADRMLLASYPTSRANHHLPPDFSNYVRQACFAKFGLPPLNAPSERIYVSRAGTTHRRVVNEEALLALLGRYGFRSVALEKLTFREQVELFHRAEAVVVTDGSSCADILFAGPIKIFILYAHEDPTTHWFTAAKGLGQQHFFVIGDAKTQHTDFAVNLTAIEHVVRDQMELRSTAG